MFIAGALCLRSGRGSKPANGCEGAQKCVIEQTLIEAIVMGGKLFLHSSPV